MQGLAPPVVCWNIQPRHRTRLIHQLRDLLFHGHAVNKIGSALFRGERGVQIRRVIRVLGVQTARAQEGNYRNWNSEVSFSHISPKRPNLHISDQMKGHASWKTGLGFSTNHPSP
jgi:hypothetical protein